MVDELECGCSVARFKFGKPTCDVECQGGHASIRRKHPDRLSVVYEHRYASAPSIRVARVWRVYAHRHRKCPCHAGLRQARQDGQAVRAARDKRAVHGQRAGRRVVEVVAGVAWPSRVRKRQRTCGGAIGSHKPRKAGRRRASAPEQHVRNAVRLVDMQGRMGEVYVDQDRLAVPKPARAAALLRGASRVRNANAHACNGRRLGLPVHRHVLPRVVKDDCHGARRAERCNAVDHVRGAVVGEEQRGPAARLKRPAPAGLGDY